MRILRALMISQAVAALGGAAFAASAGPAPLPQHAWIAPSPPHWRGGEWRGFHHEGERGRGRWFAPAIGLTGPGYDSGDYDSGVTSLAPPIWAAAPLSISVSFASPAAAGWSPPEAPRLIVIGRRASPRRPLPLVVYGDPGA